MDEAADDLLGMCVGLFIDSVLRLEPSRTKDSSSAESPRPPSSPPAAVS